MKTRSSKCALLGLLLALGAQFAAAFDGAVIANESAPAASLSADELKNILTGKTKYWDGGDAIIIVYVDGKTDAALKEASGMDSSGFKTFWQRLAFSGRGSAPKKADSVDEAVKTVASTKGAIAVVTADAATAGVKKIEIK
jgi:ABC-type phosphate transport system substrate-binding protein